MSLGFEALQAASAAASATEQAAAKLQAAHPASPTDLAEVPAERRRKFWHWDFTRCFSYKLRSVEDV